MNVTALKMLSDLDFLFDITDSWGKHQQGPLVNINTDQIVLRQRQSVQQTCTYSVEFPFKCIL